MQFNQIYTAKESGGKLRCF